MKFAYATILDLRYLPRGLALQMSVARHDPSALFVFYCMDDLAAALLELLQLAQCQIYTESDFAPGALRAVRPARSVAEYCWTAKPFILSHLLEVAPGIDWVGYLDFDMLAFGDIGDALVAAGDADFLVSPHRFAEEFVKFAPTVGTYNAGFRGLPQQRSGPRRAWSLVAALPGLVFGRSHRKHLCGSEVSRRSDGGVPDRGGERSPRTECCALEYRPLSGDRSRRARLFGRGSAPALSLSGIALAQSALGRPLRR